MVQTKLCIIFDIITSNIQLNYIKYIFTYQYLLLIHDLLDNINMRKLIIENIIIDEQDNNSSYPYGQFYKFENVSELNDIENNENEKCDEVSSFQSFSKNSVNTNISSIICNEGKNTTGKTAAGPASDFH